MNKKGQLGLGPLSGVVSIIFALFFIGVLIFAFALAGGQIIVSQQTSNNVTTNAAIEVINQTLIGAQSFADFSPVLWIMAAIAALLAILLAGIGVFFLTRR